MCIRDSVKDVNDYFVWRQNDCVRNSISMIASTLYSHKELLGKSSSDRLNMISEKGDPWDSYDDSYRYGLFLYKKKHESEARFIKENGDETELLSFTRSKWFSSPAHNFHKSPEVLNKTLKPIDS